MTHSNNSESNTNDLAPFSAAAYHDSMRDFALEMEQSNEFSQTISKRTSLIIQVVTWMAILSAIYLPGRTFTHILSD
jgi:hypothetical protein